MTSKNKKENGNASTANRNPTPVAPAGASTETVGLQMQQVLQLLSARTQGQASNEEVETAVSQVLSTAGLARPAVENNNKGKQVIKKKALPATNIKVDTEDYDFDEEEDNTKNNDGKSSVSKQKAVEGKQEISQEQQPNGGTKKETKKHDYESIPMGKQGAKMMTSFGDGPNPNPEVVSAALLGSRRLLQVSIQDARALRRKAKQQFKNAQTDVAKDYESKKTRAAARAAKANTNSQQREHPKEVADPEMLYRAMSGYDKLAYDPKCGFDYDQLKALFPEEMRAYGRWNSLRDEYASQTDDKDVATAAVEKEDGDTEKETEEPAENDVDPKDAGKDGGHLLQRAIQFDIRTDQMEEGWYMKFSEHRKGSFLPRRIKQEGDNEWEKNRKATTRKGGKQEAGIWSKMPATSARFLHWAGFDPTKGLPPPNEETTNALGFLGYDFFGRIVEKAIFLKNLTKANEEDEEVDERTILLELKRGEQLELSDLEKALDDPDIKPAAMYSAENSSGASQKPAAQLYFGPGFEDRLEMELDEIVCGSTKRPDLPEEETRIRQAEDELFAAISVPPSTTNSVMLLLGKDENGGNGDERSIFPEKDIPASAPSSQPKKKRGHKPKPKEEQNGASLQPATSSAKKRGRKHKMEVAAQESSDAPPKSPKKASEVKQEVGTRKSKRRRS